MIVIKEYLEIYGSRVELFIGNREEQKEYMAKSWGCSKFEVNLNLAGETFEMANNKTGALIGTVIWMPSFEFTSDNYATLCHECVHVAFKIAGNCGLPFSKENNENIAYLSHYFYGKFLKKLHKLQKQEDKKETKK